MEIILQRKIKLNCYEVLMDYGILIKKPVYLAILIAIKETDGIADPSYISKKLLGGRPKKAAENLIKRCIDLNLVDKKRKLTMYGKEALNDERIFMRERGTYRIWTTNDPLIPQKLIHIKPLNEEDSYFVMDDKYRLTEEIVAKQKLPNEILDFRNKRIKLFGVKRNEIKIFHIFESGRSKTLEPYEELKVKIISKPAEFNPEIVLSGKIGDLPEFENKIEQTFDLSWETIWQELLGRDYRRWNPNSRKFSCYFDELNEESLRSFITKKTFERPELKQFDSFETTTIKNIPVVPASFQDAQEWFEWLITHEIPPKYCSAKDFHEFIDMIKRMFPDFKDQLESPDQTNLAKKIRETDLGKEEGVLSQSYWRFQAPLDLILERDE